MTAIEMRAILKTFLENCKDDYVINEYVIYMCASVVN